MYLLFEKIFSRSNKDILHTNGIIFSIREACFDASTRSKNSLAGCCLATCVARMYMYRVYHELFYSEYRVPLENVHCRPSATRLSKYFKIPTPRGKHILFREPRFNDSNTRGTILFFLLCQVRPRCHRMQFDSCVRSLACSHVLRKRRLRLKLSIYPCYDLILSLSM